MEQTGGRAGAGAIAAEIGADATVSVPTGRASKITCATQRTSGLPMRAKNLAKVMLEAELAIKAYEQLEVGDE